MSALVVPAPVPATVTARQARRAIVAAGMASAVAAYIAADETGVLAIEWEYATEFDRASPFIEDARVALQLSTAQMDALFRLAASL